MPAPRDVIPRLQQLRSLLTECSGSITVTFALALLPIVGLVGAAVDYSRANSVKAAMQAAADSTALALSREASTLNQNQVQSRATALFKSIFVRPEAANVEVAAIYSTADGSQLTIKASTNVETQFMQIVGFSKLNVAVESKARWGNTRLRVALVLDTTGSMSDAGKMDQLKKATKDLLDKLKAAAPKDGDVYVSIIPFSKNVNVGSQHYNANWIDWSDWESEPPVLKSSKPSGWSDVGPGSSCPFTNNSHGFRCTTGPQSSTITSTIPSSGAYAGYICPSNDTGRINSTRIGIIYNGCYNSVPTTTTSQQTVCTGSSCQCGSTPNCSCSGSGRNRICTATVTTTGAPYTHNWIPNPKSTWNGCVIDRGTSSGPLQDYDRKVTLPNPGVQATLFPAEQNAYCSPEVMGLNYNWNSMKSMVDAMYPLGATNQPIGLVWGWQSLVGGGPFTVPAKDPKYQYTEAIILMSDGLNTLNRWSGNGSATSTAVDARMAGTSGTCANAKAAGIVIYAIHFNTDNDPKSQLLEDCASTKDKFWHVTSSTGLGTVFNHIGTALSNLRIAQ